MHEEQGADDAAPEGGGRGGDEKGEVREPADRCGGTVGDGDDPCPLPMRRLHGLRDLHHVAGEFAHQERVLFPRGPHLLLKGQGAPLEEEGVEPHDPEPCLEGLRHQGGDAPTQAVEVPGVLHQVAEGCQVLGRELGPRIVQVGVFHPVDGLRKVLLGVHRLGEHGRRVHLLQDGLLEAVLQLRIAREAQHPGHADQLGLGDPQLVRHLTDGPEGRLPHVGKQVFRHSTGLVRHVADLSHHQRLQLGTVHPVTPSPFLNTGFRSHRSLTRAAEMCQLD